MFYLFPHIILWGFQAGARESDLTNNLTTMLTYNSVVNAASMYMCAYTSNNNLTGHSTLANLYGLWQKLI